MKLHESGPLPMSALVEVALDDGPNVSRLIDRLVTAGLVNRNEDPNDRRARVLELTAAGSSLAQRVKADTPHERSVVFDGISKTDLKKLTTILESLNNNVRPSLTTKAPQ